jgi:transcriptional regulator with XRE-family HTH domain
MKKKENINTSTDYRSRIKTLRESLGMTQEQLAEKVGRTTRAIRQVENGEAFPRISTLGKIAEALNAELIISLISKGDKEIPKEKEIIIPPSIEPDDLRFGEND